MDVTGLTPGAQSEGMTYLPSAYVLDQMMGDGIYDINRVLRSGDPTRLTHRCKHSLNGAGWRSRGEFVHAVDGVFADYQSFGFLGSHAGHVAYRGMWVTPEQLTQVRNEHLLWDKGYAFACGLEAKALWHLDPSSHSSKASYAETIPLLLEVTLGRYALTIPPPGEGIPWQPREHEECLLLR